MSAPSFGFLGLFFVVLTCACSSSGDSATGSGGAGGSSGGQGGGGTGGAAGSGSGGSGGRDAAGEMPPAPDAAADMSPDGPSTTDTPASDARPDVPRDSSVDGGNCMERGYDCPGDKICMPCLTTSGVGWFCFPPGIVC